MTTAPEEREIQQIQQTVDGSQAPETLEIVEYDGQGALTEVQQPDHIVPVRPAHLDDAKDQEIGQDARQFAESVVADPSNFELGDRIFDLGSSARNLEFPSTRRVRAEKAGGCFPWRLGPVDRLFYQIALPVDPV